AAAVVLAFVAGRVGPARVEQLDDAAGQGAVGGLADLDDRLGLAGLVVVGLPATLGRVGGGCGHRDGQDGGGEEGLQGHAHACSLRNHSLPSGRRLFSLYRIRMRMEARPARRSGGPGRRPACRGPRQGTGTGVAVVPRPRSSFTGVSGSSASTCGSGRGMRGEPSTAASTASISPTVTRPMRGAIQIESCQAWYCSGSQYLGS